MSTARPRARHSRVARRRVARARAAPSSRRLISSGLISIETRILPPAGPHQWDDEEAVSASCVSPPPHTPQTARSAAGYAFTSFHRFANMLKTKIATAAPTSEITNGVQTWLGS